MTGAWGFRCTFHESTVMVTSTLSASARLPTSAGDMDGNLRAHPQAAGGRAAQGGQRHSQLRHAQSMPPDSLWKVHSAVSPFFIFLMVASRPFDGAAARRAGSRRRTLQDPSQLSAVTEKFESSETAANVAAVRASAAQRACVSMGRNLGLTAADFELLSCDLLHCRSALERNLVGDWDRGRGVMLAQVATVNASQLG